MARDNLPRLVSNLTSSAITKFDRKISGKGAVRAGKGFTFKWRYKWYHKNDKIITRFRCVNWQSYWNSKRWNKKMRNWIFWALLALLVASLQQPVISSVVKGISGRGVRKAGREYINNIF